MVYTGSGHHCGVIPYSSVRCGGLPLGLMMNNTRKNNLARVCSCGGVAPLEGLILDAYLIFSFLSSSLSLAGLIPLLPCGWLVLFIGEGPGPLPKY